MCWGWYRDVTTAWLACSSLTTYEMGKGADKLDYLAGTRDFDLPFSNVSVGVSSVPSLRLKTCPD